MIDGEQDVASGVRHCVQHPSVETVVSCGRCDQPLCPQCMIFTPVGVRCRTCAQLRRPPQYDLSPRVYARVIPGAVVVALILGYLLSLAPIYVGFLGGVIVGLVVSEALRRLSGYKQGRQMEIIAGATVVVAIISSNAFVALRALGFSQVGTVVNIAVGPSTFGYNALGIIIGVVIAVSRLR